MNKQDFVNCIAEKSGLSKADAAKAVDAYVDCLTEALKSGESVSLVGFGTFSVKRREARTGRNPRTGEKMMSKARTQAAFRPAAALKDI